MEGEREFKTPLAQRQACRRYYHSNKDYHLERQRRHRQRNRTIQTFVSSIRRSIVSHDHLPKEELVKRLMEEAINVL
jgi:hypothetical protein